MKNLLIDFLLTPIVESTYGVVSVPHFRKSKVICSGGSRGEAIWGNCPPKRLLQPLLNGDSLP